MNIYVGNLSSDVTEDDLKQAFGAHGVVQSVNLIKDKFTGEPRGFGFVVMASDDEGRNAIAALNNTDIKGKNIMCDQARPKAPSAGRREGGRGGFRGGPRGGGGGGRGGFRGGDRGGRGGDRGGDRGNRRF